MNYTKESGRWQDRKWESIPANQTDDRISARLPDGTRAYYFNLYDERDCVVSTEHEVIDAPVPEPNSVPNPTGVAPL